MILPVTSLFAALAILGLLALSIPVALMRGRERMGDQIDHNLLDHRSRAHGNFIEYVPLMLIGLAVLELEAAPLWLLILLGTLMAAGRAAHAYSLIVVEVRHKLYKWRAIGMGLTWLALVATALSLPILLLV